MVNLFWNYKLLAIRRMVKLDFLFAISDYFKCLVNEEFTFFFSLYNLKAVVTFI